MKTIYKTLLGGIVFTALFSCSSPAPLQEGRYFDPGWHDSIPYVLAKHQKEKAEKVLLILPPELDTLDLIGSDFFQSAYQAGYDILLVNKPRSKENLYRQKSLDFKGQRQSDILSTFRSLKAQGVIDPQKLVILGIGEGAYISPVIAGSLKADSTILIQGGAFYPFFTLERMGEKDSLNAVEQNYLRQKFKVDSLKQFRRLLVEVRQKKPTDYVLGNYPNIYWMSYESRGLPTEYQSMPGSAFWLFLKDHPLYRESDGNYLKVLSGTRSDPHYQINEIEGQRLSGKAEWEAIDLYLQELLKN